MASDHEGCREVQAAVEACADEETKEALASEMHGHVWEAIRCPHANHVLQKFIACARPEASQFVIDEVQVTGGAQQAARHRFGCRILERLLERCHSWQLQGLIDSLVDDALALSMHQYGNYVLQHVLQYGAPEQQRRVAGRLADSVYALGSDCHGCAVLVKALSCGSTDTRLSLARRIVAIPSLLPSMARTRHGHMAVKLVLQLLEDSPEELRRARWDLESHAHTFRSCRYGRFVNALLMNQGTVSPATTSPASESSGTIAASLAAAAAAAASVPGAGAPSTPSSSYTCSGGGTVEGVHLVPAAAFLAWQGTPPPSPGAFQPHHPLMYHHAAGRGFGGSLGGQGLRQDQQQQQQQQQQQSKAAAMQGTYCHGFLNGVHGPMLSEDAGWARVPAAAQAEATLGGA